MSEIEKRLEAIRRKYLPRMEEDKRQVEVRVQAANELMELNKRRMAAGLDYVGPASGVGHDPTKIYWTTTGKTWRDDMDAEILVAVKAWYEEVAKSGRDEAEVMWAATQ